MLLCGSCVSSQFLTVRHSSVSPWIANLREKKSVSGSYFPLIKLKNVSLLPVNFPSYLRCSLGSSHGFIQKIVNRLEVALSEISKLSGRFSTSMHNCLSIKKSSSPSLIYVLKMRFIRCSINQLIPVVGVR